MRNTKNKKSKNKWRTQRKKKQEKIKTLKRQEDTKNQHIKLKGQVKINGVPTSENAIFLVNEWKKMKISEKWKSPII
jgi:hypothetical protein